MPIFEPTTGIWNFSQIPTRTPTDPHTQSEIFVTLKGRTTPIPIKKPIASVAPTPVSNVPVTPVTGPDLTHPLPSGAFQYGDKIQLFGNVIPVDQWNTLTPSEQEGLTLAAAKGRLEGSLDSINVRRQQESVQAVASGKERSTLLSLMESYGAKTDTGYDLQLALSKGITPKDLESVFEPDKVQAAVSSRNAILATGVQPLPIKDYQDLVKAGVIDKDGVPDLTKALAKGYTPDYLNQYFKGENVTSAAQTLKGQMAPTPQLEWREVPPTIQQFEAQLQSKDPQGSYVAWTTAVNQARTRGLNETQIVEQGNAALKDYYQKVNLSTGAYKQNLPLGFARAKAPELLSDASQVATMNLKDYAIRPLPSVKSMITGEPADTTITGYNISGFLLAHRDAQGNPTSQAQRVLVDAGFDPTYVGDLSQNMVTTKDYWEPSGAFNLQGAATSGKPEVVRASQALFPDDYAKIPWWNTKATTVDSSKSYIDLGVARILPIKEAEALNRAIKDSLTPDEIQQVNSSIGLARLRAPLAGEALAKQWKAFSPAQKDKIAASFMASSDSIASANIQRGIDMLTDLGGKVTAQLVKLPERNKDDESLGTTLARNIVATGGIAVTKFGEAIGTGALSIAKSVTQNENVPVVLAKGLISPFTAAPSLVMKAVETKTPLDIGAALADLAMIAPFVKGGARLGKSVYETGVKTVLYLTDPKGVLPRTLKTPGNQPYQLVDPKTGNVVTLQAYEWDVYRVKLPDNISSVRREEIVGAAQKVAMETRKDVELELPDGTIKRIVSPAGQVIPNKLYTVVDNAVTWQNQSLGTKGMTQRGTAIVRDAQGRIVLTRIKGRDTYDLPGGEVDLGLGELPVEGAARELREEVGLEPRQASHIGSFIDSEHGKFSPRQYEVYRFTVKGTPKPSAEVVEIKLWDGKSELDYPLTSFSERALQLEKETADIPSEFDLTRKVIGRKYSGDLEFRPVRYSANPLIEGALVEEIKRTGIDAPAKDHYVQVGGAGKPTRIYFSPDAAFEFALGQAKTGGPVAPGIQVLSLSDKDIAMLTRDAEANRLSTPLKTWQEAVEDEITAKGMKLFDTGFELSTFYPGARAKVGKSTISHTQNLPMRFYATENLFKEGFVPPLQSELRAANLLALQKSVGDILYLRPRRISVTSERGATPSSLLRVDRPVYEFTPAEVTKLAKDLDREGNLSTLIGRELDTISKMTPDEQRLANQYYHANVAALSKLVTQSLYERNLKSAKEVKASLEVARDENGRVVTELRAIVPQEREPSILSPESNRDLWNEIGPSEGLRFAPDVSRDIFSSERERIPSITEFRPLESLRLEERVPPEERIVPPEERIPPEERPPEEKLPPLEEETPPPEEGTPPIETPPPVEPPPPVGMMKEQLEKEALREAFRGSTGWQQGFGVWALKEPYQTKEDFHFFYKNNIPPDFQMVEGGPRAAYRSIQAKGFKIPVDLVLKLGIQDIKVSSPTLEPGKPGGIQFVETYQSGRGSTANLDLKLHEIPTSQRRFAPAYVEPVPESVQNAVPQFENRPRPIAQQIMKMQAVEDEVLSGKPVTRESVSEEEPLPAPQITTITGRIFK